VTSDEDRIAYLAGDIGAPLDPDEQVDLDAVRDLLSDPAMWAEPEPSLEDRIVAAITAEAAEGRRGQPVALSPARAGRRRRQSRRRPLLSGAVGAAAAVLVAIAITVAVTTGGSSAQRFTAALSANDVVPGATATATLTRTTSGWEIELHASGLPRLDNGRYYEAWMKNAAGVVVPVGTFNQGPKVTLWSGVSPKDFPEIVVTQQGTAGTDTSGRQVLAGTVRPGT
jgi:hypothetical protein